MTQHTATSSSEQPVITLGDVVGFVARNHDRLLPTIGGDTKFSVTRATNKIVFKPPRDQFDGNLVKVLALFNESPSYKTTRFTKTTANASYLLGMFWEIVVERRSMDPPEETPNEEKEILSAPLSQQKALRQARNGQGQYKKKLLSLRKICYITGLAEREFLRASHILPWAKCDNNAQRLDEYNGLLLSPNLDTLFDKGFISFEDNGAILISSKLPPSVEEAFGVNRSFRGVDLGDRTKSYLARHRSIVFKQPAR
jgi:hypothetical protein